MCYPWSHRDAFAFVLPQGGSARLTDTAQRRHCQFVVKQCGTPHCVPAGILTFPELSLSLRRHARHVVILSVRRSLLSFWALLPLEDLQVPVVRTRILRIWNARPACGTAFSSVHHILSVFGLVPTRDEPAECLPWTRRTGVRRCFPCSGNVRAHSGRRWPRPYVR